MTSLHNENQQSQAAVNTNLPITFTAGLISYSISGLNHYERLCIIIIIKKSENIDDLVLVLPTAQGD